MTHIIYIQLLNSFEETISVTLIPDLFKQKGH